MKTELFLMTFEFLDPRKLHLSPQKALPKMHPNTSQVVSPIRSPKMKNAKTVISKMPQLKPIHSHYTRTPESAYQPPQPARNSTLSTGHSRNWLATISPQAHSGKVTRQRCMARGDSGEAHAGINKQGKGQKTTRRKGEYPRSTELVALDVDGAAGQTNREEATDGFFVEFGGEDTAFV